MRSIKRAGYFLLITTIFILGCDVSTFLAPPALPTLAPNSVQTIIIQTAARAASQTAILITPTLTPSITPTFTAFPSQTASTSPTVTETFVFRLLTPTSASDSWSCTLLGQDPVKGASFAANKPFTANWSVQNTGLLTWIRSNVDLIHVGGTLLAAKAGYDTKFDVAVGSSEVLSIPMTAPASSGSYTSNWTLRTHNTLFCALSVSIIVP